MNRQRYIDRDFENEGSPRSQEFAAALATRFDPGFLESLTRHLDALDEFGGELYIAPARAKFDGEGNRVDGRHARSWESVGYIFHYGAKARLKRLEEVAEESSPCQRRSSQSPRASENGVPEEVAEWLTAPASSVDQSPELQDILKKVKKRKELSERARKPYVDRWREWYGLHRNYRRWARAQNTADTEPDRDENMREGQREFGAELFIPYCFATIEAMVPRVLMNNPMMKVKPKKGLKPEAVRRDQAYL